MTLRGVAFDLDDTLFLERTYVLSGFAAVASHIAAIHAIEPEGIVKQLLALEAAGYQGRVFDTWLEGRDQPTGGLTVDDLVGIYRSHQPNISLLPGVLDMFESLRNASYRLAIVSDGPLQSQRAKVKALGLEHLVDGILLTDKWGADFWKPHHRAFEQLESDWSCSPSELVYVGDNPGKDFVGPKSRGWLTIRLRLEGQRFRWVEARSAGSLARLEFDSLATLSSFLIVHAGP